MGGLVGVAVVAATMDKSLGIGKSRRAKIMQDYLSL